MSAQLVEIWAVLRVGDACTPDEAVERVERMTPPVEGYFLVAEQGALSLPSERES